MPSKPIDSLTLDDIAKHPIWEFAIDEEGNDEQDETWVRPVDSDVIPMDEYSMSVAADFFAPSGARFEGIVGVDTSDGIELSHAALISTDQYIFVPAPTYRGADLEYDRIASQLGLPKASLFPLRCELRVRIDGEDFLRSCEFGSPTT